MTALVAIVVATGCEKDNIWGDGDPAMEHIYYVGFFKSTPGSTTTVFSDYYICEIESDGAARWGLLNDNGKTYGTTARGWVTSAEANTVQVEIQLHSERVRSYDAVSYFWIVNDAANATPLVAGTDYTVSFEGQTLTPDGAGTYSLTWAQTKKGVKAVKVTRNTAATGLLYVNLLNPDITGAPSSMDLTTTVNHHADEYEIRGLVDGDWELDDTTPKSKCQIIFK
jgi:hypothetical protein